MPFGKAGIEWLKSDTCLIDNNFEWGGNVNTTDNKGESLIQANKEII
jgi:hypothetical protein